MIRNNSPLTPTESYADGWVGVADSLVGAIVLFLVLALAAANKLNSANTQVVVYKSLLHEKDDEIQLLREQLSNNSKRNEEFKSANDERLNSHSKAASVHAELLSIKGNLDKVVIILDFSGSMIEKRGKQESRWTISKRFINNVCQHLDMGECVLVVFSYDIKVFGSNNTTFNNLTESPGIASDEVKRIWTDYATKRPLKEGEKKALFELGQLSDKDLQSLRQLKPFKLRGELNDRKVLADLVTHLPNPAGGTNTLKAINAALEIEGVTNIILFTDGEPGLLAERISDDERRKLENSGIRVKPPDFPFQKDWIFATVDERIATYTAAGKEFPRINAIGIGDYFDNDLSNFLRTLSEEKTDGSFQGR